MMSNSYARLMKHVHAHEAVVANEYWYCDGPARLKASFSAAKTSERQAEVVDLLEKAANKTKATGDRRQARLLKRLARKLDRCRRRDRCGSLACPQCARAFQRAKAAAQRQVIKHSANKSPPGPNASTKSADSNSQPQSPARPTACLEPVSTDLTGAPCHSTKCDCHDAAPDPSPHMGQQPWRYRGRSLPLVGCSLANRQPVVNPLLEVDERVSHVPVRRSRGDGGILPFYA